MKSILRIALILICVVSQNVNAGEPSKMGAQAFKKFIAITKHDVENPMDNTRSTIPGDDSKLHAILKTKDGFKTGTIEGVVKRRSGEVLTFKFKLDRVKGQVDDDFIELRRENDMIVVDRNNVRQQFAIESEKSTALRAQKQYLEFDDDGEKKLAVHLENAKNKKSRQSKNMRITTVKNDGKEKNVLVDLARVKGKIVSFQPKLSKDKKSVATRIIASESGKFREYNSIVELRNSGKKQKLTAGKILSSKKVKAENILAESTIYKPIREIKKSREAASVKTSRRQTLASEVIKVEK